MFSDLRSNEVQGSTNICNTRLNGLSGISHIKYYGVQRKEKLYLFGKGFIKVTLRGGEITGENVREKSQGKNLKGTKLSSLLRT